MKKEKIIKFVTISLLAIIMYINFVTVYYSIDSHLILRLGLDGYAINYSLYDGRIVMAGLCFFANTINMPLNVFYCISIIIALLISAVCVLKIYNIIQNIKPTKNNLIKCLLLIISYTYIFNFMYIDSMQFIEAIVIAISILLYIIAAEKLIIKQKKIISLILVVIAIFFYQGTINVFISLTCLLIILKYKKIDKEIIKYIAIAAGITAIAVICNFVVVNVIHEFIDIERSLRINFNIVENIEKITKKGLSILFVDSLKLFPNYVFITFVVMQTVILGIYAIKHNEKKKIVKLLFIIVSYILSCLLLALVNAGIIHNGNGRVFASIGALISAISIYIYCCTKILEDAKYLKTIFIGIVCVYFIINFCNTFYLTLEAKKLNICDKKFSEKILDSIEKYEEENNIKVKKMSYRYILKENQILELPKTIYAVSMKKLGEYNEYILKLYTGRLLEKVKFDNEIFEKFSKEKEEIKFINDTIYFTIEY